MYFKRLKHFYALLLREWYSIILFIMKKLCIMFKMDLKNDKKEETSYFQIKGFEL